MNDFTHFSETGYARMVDVGEKPVTRRTAKAAGRVHVDRKTLELIRSGGVYKGDVLTVAQLAGILGAKNTPQWIPMCHPLSMDACDVTLQLNDADSTVEIVAVVSCMGRTGVEMEALCAVSAAALTVYDMCKAVERGMVISDIRLLEKTGGQHGAYRREDAQ